MNGKEGIKRRLLPRDRLFEKILWDATVASMGDEQLRDVVDAAVAARTLHQLSSGPSYHVRARSSISKISVPSPDSRM